MAKKILGLDIQDNALSAVLINSGIKGNRDPMLRVFNNIVAANGDCGISFDTSYDWGAPTSDYNDVFPVAFEA